jgi:SAM-dependent methyltransferase
MEMAIIARRLKVKLKEDFGMPDMAKWYEAKYQTWTLDDRERILRYKIAIEHLDIEPGMMVADLGCRDGILSTLIPECGYCGYDIAPPEKRHTGLIQKQNICRDILGCEVYDIVIAMAIIEHVSSPMRLMENIEKILKPSGLALISAPNVYHWARMADNLFKRPDRSGHIQMFRWKEIDSLARLVGLRVISQHRGIDHIPKVPWRGLKKGYIPVRAKLPFQARTIQYVLGKK